MREAGTIAAAVFTVVLVAVVGLSCDGRHFALALVGLGAMSGSAIAGVAKSNSNPAPRVKRSEALTRGATFERCSDAQADSPVGRLRPVALGPRRDPVRQLVPAAGGARVVDADVSHRVAVVL